MDPVAFRSYGDNIKPMLASPPKPGQHVHGRDFAGWYFDVKLDGVRAIAHWDGFGLRLINRSMKDVTHRYPDLEMAAVSIGSPFRPGVPMILDGEIVAQSGSFQDTAKRDKQTKPADVAAAIKTHPVNFVAFDILYCEGSDVRTLPYSQRRYHLELAMDEKNLFAISVCSKESSFFNVVKEAGMEGVIAKHPRSQYRAGRFSDWVKFKTLRSITAIGLGYDLGEGARAHFGAMRLVLLGADNKPVDIGRVGTGFKPLYETIDYLKAELDAGRPVVCEIECLNKSKDGQLRFPVYKGLRTDLSVVDATIDQLDAIPTM